MTCLTMDHFRKACSLVSSVPSCINLRIIEDRNIGKRVTRFRFRTWKERLFTLPWRPLKKMAFYTITVAEGNFYHLGKQNVIIGHPDDVFKLKTELREGRMSRKTQRRTLNIHGEKGW